MPQLSKRKKVRDYSEWKKVAKTFNSCMASSEFFTHLVVNYRSAEGSIIQLLVRINTLMHSFRPVFLLFKKYCFHQGDKGAEGKALERDERSYFQYISSENRRTFVPVASVKQRGVKSEMRSACLTKGKLLWRISSERKTRVSTADGSFIVMARGGESQRREMRDHKKGWRHGWTVTHLPLWRGILLTWPLVCHHVTSPVMSLHPVRLCCIVLYCMWTRE